MPRVYRGSFREASIQHPITGRWIVVQRGEPTFELDDLPLGPDGAEYDLGAEWATEVAPDLDDDPLDELEPAPVVVDVVAPIIHPSPADVVVDPINPEEV